LIAGLIPPSFEEDWVEIAGFILPEDYVFHLALASGNFPDLRM
jgi:hypothetical protein